MMRLRDAIDAIRGVSSGNGEVPNREDEDRTRLFRGMLGVVGLNDPPAGGSLQQYLNDVYGERHSFFSAEELKGKGRQLPPTKWWPRVALLRWLLDECRDAEPIRVAHVYRSKHYNQQVGGAPESAHVDCCAVDIDVQSTYERNRILARVLHPLYNSPINLGMGLGVGRTRLHVDFFSPTWSKKGRERWWAYDSAKSYKGPGQHPG